MTFHHLLQLLDTKKIKVFLKGNDLQFKAPKGSLTNDLVEQLKTFKPDLIELLKEKDFQTGFQEIKSVQTSESYELSHGQKRLWLLHKMNHGHDAYNMPGAYYLNSSIDYTLLQQSLTTLVERHESLRTVFIDVEGEPKQRVLSIDTMETKLQFVDLTGQNEKTIDSLVDEYTNVQFELNEGPLMKSCLVKVTDCKHLFLFTLHHIVTDAWSMEILFSELCQIYGQLHHKNKIELPPLDIHYKDYAIWQNHRLKSGDYNAHRSFWLNMFETGFEALNLPTDFKRPSVRNFRGENLLYTLPKLTYQKIKAFIHASEVNLFSLFQTVFRVLLYRYTSQSDVVVGVPVSGREHGDLERQIGFFVNTIPLRFNLNAEQSFLENLKTVHKLTLEAFSYQDYPFDLLVEELDLPHDQSRSALFDVMFDLNIMEKQTFTDALPFDVEPYSVDYKTSKFDLTLNVLEHETTIDIHIEYSSEIFKEETVVRFLKNLETLLWDAIQTPEKNLNSISVLSSDEKKQIANSFMGKIEQQEETSETILDLFEDRVRKHPKHIAVDDGNSHIDYQTLNQKANILAMHLLSIGVKSNDLIGIMITRSYNMFVTALGVMKAGAAFVPIDPDYPKDRVKHILSDSHIELVISESSILFEHHSRLDIDLFDFTNQSDGAFRHTAQPSDLAYVIYTSGSTGKPKGVMVTHANLINISRAWRTEYQLDTFQVKLLQVASMAFDVFCGDLCRGLLNGGTIYICPADIKMDANALYNLIASKQINIFEATPALVLPLMEDVYTEHKEISFLKLLILGSDTCRIEEFRTLLRRFGKQMRILNSYGTTETTIDSSFYEALPDALPPYGTVPIGKPLLNTIYHILDSQQNMVPIGVSGDLYIGGMGVAKGYLHRERLTNDRFISHPDTGDRIYKTGDLAKWLSDGNVMFLGRNDDQLKIRGYRVEIGEIESCLLRYPGVTNVCITVEEEQGDLFLIAYIQSKKPLVTNVLREYLARLLPYYMIPRFFSFLEEIPLSPNGKVDRKQLPCSKTLGLSRESAHVEPKNKTERILCGIFEEVLKQRPVGVEDNFFELGGQSLKATQIVARVYKEFSRSIELKDVFENPRVIVLATLIENKDQTRFEPIPRLAEQTYYEISHAQKRLWMFEQMNPGSITYANLELYRLSGNLDINCLNRALQSLVDRYEILRTTLFTENELPKQKINKNIFSVSLIDYTGKTVHFNEIKDVLTQKTNLQFDLESDSFLKVTVVRTAPQQHILCFVMHHIIYDEWSLGLLFNEICELYNSELEQRFSELPELSIQYKEYAHWHNHILEHSGDRYKSFWTSYLSQPMARLDLATDYDRPEIYGEESGFVELEFDETLSKQIDGFLKTYEVSSYLFFLSIFQCILYRYSGNETFLIGSPFSGRNHVDLENQIGFFINTIPVYTNIKSEMSFQEVLNKAQKTLTAVHEHSLYPFDLIVNCIDVPRVDDRSLLFDVGFSWNDDTAVKGASLLDVTIDPIELEGSLKAKADLWLHATKPDGNYQISLEYLLTLFKASTAKLMLERAELLSRAVVEDASVIIAELSFQENEPSEFQDFSINLNL